MIKLFLYHYNKTEEKMKKIFLVSALIFCIQSIMFSDPLFYLTSSRKVFEISFNIMDEKIYGGSFDIYFPETYDTIFDFRV